MLKAKEDEWESDSEGKLAKIVESDLDNSSDSDNSQSSMASGLSDYEKKRKEVKQ